MKGKKKVPGQFGKNSDNIDFAFNIPDKITLLYTGLQIKQTVIKPYSLSLQVN